MKIEEMKVVCAWCGKLLSGNDSMKDTSHGMCKECYEKETQRLRTYYEDHKREKNFI